MSPDQYTSQDPTRQYRSPDTDGDQIDYPGQTGAMHDKPDHGENSYRGSHRLDDRVAVITGGDSGIGRAVALAFAREGADVVISYLPAEEKDAQQTARLVEDAGRRAVTVAGDLVEEKRCQLLIDRAVQEFGRIDILVNNAAYQMVQMGGIEDITTEQFDRVLKTNLYAMFWLCKCAIPHMRPGTSIINTSSIQAFDPSPELLDYAITKAGIVNFTKVCPECSLIEASGLTRSRRGRSGHRLFPRPCPRPRWTPTDKRCPCSARDNLPRSLPPTSFSPRRNPATSLRRFSASPVVSL